MKQYDPNLAVETTKTNEDLIWHELPLAEIDLYGFDGTDALLSRRLPMEVAEQVSPGVLGQSGYAAGGHARFCTDSGVIAIRAQYGEAYHPTCAPSCLAFGFDLYRCDAQGVETFAHTYRPPRNDMGHERFESVLTDATPGHYTLNFPCFSEVTSLAIGLEKGAVLSRGLPYRNETPVIFYGSSITHGAAASRPGNTYEAFISQRLNMNYVNLGFAGNAKGETRMAEYIASREMSVFVCDYDYNAPDVAHLERTHHPFYRVIRERYPDLPYVMVSKPDFFRHPTQDAARREVIRRSYQRALAEGDRNVYFIDGETLFGDDFAASCTVDGCHPCDLGFYRMAQRIGALLEKLL